jgi:hypothetical protein
MRVMIKCEENKWTQKYNSNEEKGCGKKQNDDVKE